MSEYQYYEFMALDRRLTPAQQRQLREISSRGTITETRLVSDYHRGDFKADPLEMLEKYFDAHLYYANWGTRILMFAFPAALVDADALAAYADDETVQVTERGGRVILELAQSECDDLWDSRQESVLAGLIPLRNDIVAGDLRSLYIAALNGLGFWMDEIEIDEELEDEVHLEPPLPAGLGQLTAPLEALVELLEVDPDMLAAAAEGSPPLPASELSDAALERWLRFLPERQKDEYLLRVVRGELNVPNDLRLRFFAEQHSAASKPVARPRRQVAALIGRAEKLRVERHAAEAHQREAEEARRRDERARERAAHLAGLRGNEQRLWGQAEALANTKRPGGYDRAIALLADLRDLAREGEHWDEFQSRLHAFRRAHVRKPALMHRLDAAGLR